MSKYCVQVAWEDVPHLTDKDIAELEKEIPPHLREARTKGLPFMGAGIVYPVPEEAIIVDPFEVPAHWPRAYGFDPDWNRTAAVWGAWDRDGDIVYLYSEYFGTQVPPAVHASAVMARGDWMTGASDPSINGKINVLDGVRLDEEYRRLGLRLVDADNAVEAGTFAVYQRLARGGLKVFTTLTNWRREYRTYRREEVEGGRRSKIIKENDDEMDATRYLIMTGMRYAAIDPGEWEEMEAAARPQGRNPDTGY